MQQQTSALQKLADLFEKASAYNGDKSKLSISVLSEIMKSSYSTDDPVEFFGLLYKAKEEVDKINKLRPNGSRHPIQKLHDFIVENVYKITWTQLKSHIEDKGIIDLLNSLAENYKNRNPTIFLESEFLDGLKDEFKSLLDEILRSDLSKNLKIFLTKQIEDILYAIRRYSIDGTEGVEKATKLFVSNLVMVEKHIDKKDKKNSIFNRCLAGVSSLLVILRPGPYDAITVVPTIDDYYRPRIEEFVKNWQEVEESSDEASTFTEIIERSLQLSNKQSQKNLQGKEQLSLPSAQINEEPPLEMEANLED